MPEERYVARGGVRLHVLDSGVGASEGLTPIVFIPGMLGSAEDYSAEMASLSARRCIALSLRGRGRSDTPESGYSFPDHVRDIEALIDRLCLEGFCLMGYSVGVTYVIRYAATRPDSLKGLVLGDYPARYPHFGSEWVDRVLSFSPPRAPEHVVRALQQESAEVLLWEDLVRISCPVLILRGGQPDSLLSAEAAETYRRKLTKVKVVLFEDSGHDISKPDYNRYVKAIGSFLEEIDSAKSSSH